MHFIRTTHFNSCISRTSLLIPQCTAILRLSCHKVPFSYEHGVKIRRKEASRALARTAAATSEEYSMFMSKQSTLPINMRMVPGSAPPSSFSFRSLSSRMLFGHITMPFECHKQNIKCCAYLSSERVNEGTRRCCQCTIHIQIKVLRLPKSASTSGPQRSGWDRLKEMRRLPDRYSKVRSC